MCGPVAIGVASLVTTAVGVGVNAYSQYKQRKAENEAAEYNAQLLERNAEIAEQQAQESERMGKKEEMDFRRRLGSFKGSQRSALAGSGVVVDQGSALTNLMDTTEYGEMDAMTIRHNIAKEAWGHRMQRQDIIGQARLSRMRKSSPWLNTGSSLLTGASNLGNQYMTGYNSGIFK